MWEKEVISTFKLKYATKWSNQYASKMITVKSDSREDDVILTPKRQKQLAEKKEEALQRLKDLALDNRANKQQAQSQPSKKKRPQKKQARSPGSKSKADQGATPELEEERKAVAELPQVDTFPNDQLNPLTKLSQANFEENEAAPPTLDSFAKSKIERQGQFLAKNTEWLPEDAKRMRLLEERQRSDGLLPLRRRMTVTTKARASKSGYMKRRETTNVGDFDSAGLSNKLVNQSKSTTSQFL